MDDPFWWIDKRFEVSERDMPTNLQAGEGSYLCRVWGQDCPLDLYECEVIGGAMDGSRFFVGPTWIKDHVQ